MPTVVNKDGGGLGARTATAQTDRPYSSPNRKNAGSPLNSVVPMYSGEIIQDTTNGAIFYALGTTSADWVSAAVQA